MISTSIEKNSLLYSNKENKGNKIGGLGIILKVMEDILRDGITKDELLRSKTNIVNKLSMTYENTHSIAMYYNEMVLMEHSPIVTIHDFIKGIKNIKVSEVNEVIKKYLSFEKMTICVVGNYTKDEIIKSLSEQF